MSTPNPRVPQRLAAVIGMRPSPEPRSKRTSFLPTFATFSISSTTFSFVGTYGTSGDFSSGLSGWATTAAEATARVTASTRADRTRGLRSMGESSFSVAGPSTDGRAGRR